MAQPLAATHAVEPAIHGGHGRSPRYVREFGRLLRPAAWSRLRRVVDVLVLYLAASAAAFADPRLQTSVSNHWLAAAFPLIVIAILQLRPGPDELLSGSLLDLGAYLLGVISMATMLTITVDSLLGGAWPLGLALRLWLFASVYLGTARIVLHSLRRQAVRNRALSVPTLIIGAGVIGGHLVKRLASDPSYGLRPVGFLDANPLPRDATYLDGQAVPVLGDPGDLDEAILMTGARHVIIAFSGEPDHVLVSKVRRCERLGVEVSLVPRLYEAINARTTLDHVGGLPLLALHSVDPRGWQFAVKHSIDRTIAAVVLLLSSPLLLVVCGLVRLSSPGPILFRQRRVGRDGREFNVLKFRTMRVSAPAAAAFELPEGIAPGGIEGTDRRTRIGRVLRDLSVDELPQLINVLRGDMSIVGPRPERPEFVARFARDVARYEDRHRVKSGITGWAQVHGLRGQTSIADRVEWDNYYILNWSLTLDLRILMLTVAEILRFRG